MKAVLLTGGNLGNLDMLMRQARDTIVSRIGKIIAESKIYVSEAWGFESNNLFKNQVIIVETELSPIELLDATQRIEIELGRVRNPDIKGYSSRTMDIDILYIDKCVISSRRLIVPHPLISKREFVLTPLIDVAPRLVDPTNNKTPQQMLTDLKNSKTKTLIL